MSAVTQVLEVHPLYDPSIDYVGPMNWPKFLLKGINATTLGAFNYAAFLHDIGAMANTKKLRDENDKAFYRRLDAIVDAEKNWFKRQYLRFFKHFFYKAVRLNPSHYEGDEINIKVERQLDAKLVEYKNRYDAKIAEVDAKLKELSEARKAVFLEKKELREEERDLSKVINLRNVQKMKDNTPNALVDFKKKELEEKKKVG